MGFEEFVVVGALVLALFLAVINERLVEWFVNPLFARFKVDTFYLTYVALVSGVALSLAVGANVFAAESIPQTVGLILTALFVGGGSNLLHQITQPKSIKSEWLSSVAVEEQGEGAS